VSDGQDNLIVNQQHSFPKSNWCWKSISNYDCSFFFGGQRYEETYMTRLPVTKQEKHKQGKLSTLGTLGDELTNFSRKRSASTGGGKKRKAGKGGKKKFRK